MAKILISGGSGTIGRIISTRLLQNGHEVRWLTRRDEKADNIQTFRWDPLAGKVDEAAFNGVEHIIHLAGSSIGEKAWTKRNKKIMLDSRVRTAEFLFNCYKNYKFPLQTFTGASAIGIYGSQPEEELVYEDHSPGEDFMADVCVNWEKAYTAFKSHGIRTITFRLGIVLSKNSGIYAKLKPLFSVGLGSVIGDGNNFFSWIHEKDVSEIFCFALKNSDIKGVFNVVSPEPLSAKDFYETLAENFGRKIWLPKLPAFAIKLFLGERSAIILGGKKISNDKLLKSGFKFQFCNLKSALSDLRY